MSTPVNMANVNALGSQFTQNIFKDVARKSFRTAGNLRRQIGKPATVTNAGGFNYRTTANPSAAKVPLGLPAGSNPRTGPAAPNQLPRSPQGLHRNYFYMQPAIGGAATPQAIGTGQKQLTTGQKALTPVPLSQNAVNRINQVITTPYNPPPRTFAMPESVSMTRNTAGPAYANVEGTPATPPDVSGSEGKASPVQFADVSTKSNAPYPTHVHPEGSSSMVLPRLTAAQPRPNQFTVGSRNIRGGGIAAMGSKLEEGLSTRPLRVPQPRKRV